MKTILISFSILLFCSFIPHQFPCKVIKQMVVPHCAKGTENCKKCRKNTKQEWVLLNLCLEKPGEVARPVTSIKFHNKEFMKEYEVVQKFKSEEKAKKYGKDNMIEVQ